MQAGKEAFRARRSAAWTRERIGSLSKQEIQQLRANAGDLGEQDIVTLCDEALRSLPEGAGAEGLLVFGERLDGHLPEERARSVHGVDPETVLRFKVEKQGDEYWAVWGKKI